MGIVPNHSLQNLPVNDSYGSLLLVVPNPPASPKTEGIITSYKKLASGDGNNTLIGISETGLKILSGGELTADEGVVLSGFIISGEDNHLQIKTDTIPPSELLPGELVLVDKVLYFLDANNTIQSFDLGVLPTGTTITYDPVELTASANLPGKVFNFQEKILLSGSEPNPADYPEGMLWLNNAVSPYVLHYLDLSGTPTWLPVTGQDVATHAAIYGLGGHIPTTGITDAEVNSITTAKITDLDLSGFVNVPVVDDITGPVVADLKSPWVKDNTLYWFINSQYRTGVELDQSVVINNPAGVIAPVGGFPPGYSYIMKKISVLWDIEPPDGDTTLLNSSHKYMVIFTRGATTYGTINIDRDTDPAEVLIPLTSEENPSIDFAYQIVADVVTVGSPPTLNNIVVILSYQKILI